MGKADGLRRVIALHGCGNGIRVIGVAEDKHAQQVEVLVGLAAQRGQALGDVDACSVFSRLSSISLAASMPAARLVSNLGRQRSWLTPPPPWQRGPAATSAALRRGRLDRPAWR
jgi:hypothetical protein